MTTNVPSILANMTANVNVGIDEVCSVFVSKWEDGLFAKKDDLSAKIKAVKAELDAMEKRLIASFNIDKYVMTVELLGIVSKVEEVVVVWSKDEHDYSNRKKNVVRANIGVYDVDEDRSYASITKHVFNPISPDDVKRKAEIDDTLANLNQQLIATMAEIKSVSRKERQIRGRISEMKLEQCGLTELATNPDLLKLIEVK